MTLSIEQAIGQKLLLAFAGKERPSKEIIEALRTIRPGGISLFRSLNIDNPAQVRTLTESLQRLAQNFDLPPLLIATDQEGGQLMAIGEGTPLPGNMALGATGSTELARRAGEVLGRELAAMGVNVNYAPCADVNSNPRNPVVGIRSFGENPLEAARLTAAMVEGIQSTGVAATAKHFPGHGDTASDSHHGLPTVPHTMDRLRAVELHPFRSSIQAGVKLIMSAHVALPAVDGREAPPATLSPTILKGLLRGELGFEGVIVTDAMDMHAIHQGEALGEEAVRAVNAGVDLLLLTSNADDHQRVYDSLVQAVQAGTVNSSELFESAQRILALKRWLGQPEKVDLSVIGSHAHHEVADEIAARSITLVRDQAGWLPLRLKAEERIAVIIPEPLDLTPADTSSYVKPALAHAMRTYHANVDDFIIPHAPENSDIAALIEKCQNYHLIIIGTLNAFNQPGQATLVLEILKRNIPTIATALRLPYDLMTFPDAPTYICTYSILEPSMKALARALFGQAAFQGQLPVSIPGLYEAGAPV